MPEGRRKLSVAELSNEFETDAAGSLFWKGKKVRVGGWSATDRIAVIAVIVAALVAVAVNYPNLKTLWSDLKQYVEAVSKGSDPSH